MADIKQEISGLGFHCGCCIFHIEKQEFWYEEPLLFYIRQKPEVYQGALRNFADIIRRKIL